MERNTIVVADALEWCRSLGAGSVDVWWSSPPYNLADSFRSGNFRAGKQRPRYVYDEGGQGDGSLVDEPAYQQEQEAVLAEWYRALDDHGVAFYSHKIRIKDGRAISPLEWIYRTPFVFLQEVVWDRGGTPNTDARRFLPVSERIYILSKRPGLRLNNAEFLRDVVYLSPTPHRATSGHPCPTPPRLVRMCLSVVPRSERRLLVADSYVGSGTTPLQAMQLGMDYIGCDHSAAYVELARRNLDPLPLFADVTLEGVAG